MFGVVVASHGEVAGALVEAAAAMLGPLDRIQAVTVTAGSDLSDTRAGVRAAIHQVDGGEGVLVLCDLLGGTPSNICLSIDHGTRVEVLTGVNLPMLLKSATLQLAGATLQQAAELLVEYGRQHITRATCSPPAHAPPR